MSETEAGTPRHDVFLRFGLIVLVIGACIVMWPFGAWLTLAAWFSALVRPVVERLARVTHGRRPAAAISTLLLLVVSIGPLVGMVISLAADAATLVRDVMATRSGRQAVIAIVSPEGEGAAPVSFDLPTLLSIFRSQGERAWTFASTVAGATADLVLGLFVFFSAAFFALVDGPRAFEWVAQHTPISHRHAVRLASAFVETGRGLFVGIGLTGLVQAGIATLAYGVLGVPRAFALGMLTFIASFIPTIGTSLIWIPVAAGLALTGRPTAAIALAAVGIFVVGTIDNFLRPVLARWGQLQMHTFLVLVSMLGGLAVFGGAGLIMGPLIIRLTLEALRIAKEEQLV